VKNRDAETRIETPRFTIEGKSRAGHEPWFRIRELGVALDIGRGPDAIIGVSNVFVTHSHLDHALGIPFYAAQRKLQQLPAGRVYIPAESLAGFTALMRLHEELENTTYPLELVGLAPGDELILRRDLGVRAHRSSHRVPSNGYEFFDRRTRIDPSLIGLAGEEIGRIRKESPELFPMEAVPILYYTGDTDAGCFDDNGAIYRAEVLMIECSFTRDDDRDRAARYQHIHLDDLFERASLFENELIVLTHFSLRDAPEEVHGLISRRAPERLRDRIRLALPEPLVRLAG
jgi:ribonuclease Z